MARDHAQLCRARLTGRNADCECDAADNTRTKLFTPGGMVNRIEELGAAPEPPSRSRRVQSTATNSADVLVDPVAAAASILGIDTDAPEPDPPTPLACRRCSECMGQEHHWIENPDFEDEDDPEFACKHCDALCEADDDDDGIPAPSGEALREDAPSVRVMPRQFLTEEQRRGLMNAWGRILGRGAPADPVVEDKTYLDHIGSMVSDRSYGLVSLSREEDYAIDEIKDRPIRIHQVCPACREAYMVKTGDRPSEMEAFANVGLVARRARLMHKCPDVTAHLAVLSFDGLNELHEDLERRGEQMLTRSREVKDFADQRRAREIDLGGNHE